MCSVALYVTDYPISKGSMKNVFSGENFKGKVTTLHCFCPPYRGLQKQWLSLQGFIGPYVQNFFILEEVATAQVQTCAWEGPTQLSPQAPAP